MNYSFIDSLDRNFNIPVNDILTGRQLHAVRLRSQSPAHERKAFIVSLTVRMLLPQLLYLDCDNLIAIKAST